MQAGTRKTRSHRRRGALVALLAVTLTGLVAAATALAAAPRSTSPPTIDGTFRQGSTLTTSNGLWANSPTSYTYRWQRCDSNGANCVLITGETGRRYRLVQADVGRTIVSLVTARNADGSDTANSRPTPVIADNTTPQNTKEPSISGNAIVGEQPDRRRGYLDRRTELPVQLAPVRRGRLRLHGHRHLEAARTASARPTRAARFASRCGRRTRAARRPRSRIRLPSCAPVVAEAAVAARRSRSRASRFRIGS